MSKKRNGKKERNQEIRAQNKEYHERLAELQK